jgi:hypothetical protein
MLAGASYICLNICNSIEKAEGWRLVLLLCLTCVCITLVILLPFSAFHDVVMHYLGLGSDQHYGCIYQNLALEEDLTKFMAKIAMARPPSI